MNIDHVFVTGTPVHSCPIAIAIARILWVVYASAFGIYWVRIIAQRLHEVRFFNYRMIKAAISVMVVFGSADRVAPKVLSFLFVNYPRRENC